MKNSIAVIGLGSFGFSVAEALVQRGTQVLAIDMDRSLINEASEIVTNAVALDATDERALSRLDLDDIETAVIAVGDMESSILISMMLKEKGVQYVIVKALNTHHKKVLERIGADRVIEPEKEMGKSLARQISGSFLFDQIEVSEKYSMVEKLVFDKWIGKTIRSVDVRHNYGVSIIGIKRIYSEVDNRGEVKISEDIIMAPSGDTEFKKDDVLIILGDKQLIAKLK